ncbi:MAG: sigma-54 dependent transcriptional regulator [Bacteroidetes bacterium]|nr:sigma-54 dependent transcriptional regulator [Bacteroidota bacterium]
MRSETILVVDDEKLIRWSLKQNLQKESFNVLEAESVKIGLELVSESEPDLIILDQRLPDGTGIEFIQKLREMSFDNPIVMLSAVDTSNVAVQAMKLGAFDYVTKPVNFDELKVVIEKAMESIRLKRQVVFLRGEQKKQFGNFVMIGDSPVMKKLFNMISKIAASDSSTVLVTGESGVGKELVVRTIHALSERKDKCFMAVNCASLTESLIESELFGHQKGAFTDAKNLKKGMFELADGGSIFLDEIGDISPNLQVKLLRVLDQKSFKRVGGSSEISVDIRIITATNQPLENKVAEGKFRADLFYRLNVVHLYVPPLRERGNDILLLAQYFLQEFNKVFRKNFKGLSDETKELFLKYDWPGNVRELRNVIERAVLLDEGDYIFSHDVELGHLHTLSKKESTGYTTANRSLTFSQIEKNAVLDALTKTDFNQSQAAKLLQISRDQLRYKMKKLGIKSKGIKKLQ